jgi:hypothetical protein
MSREELVERVVAVMLTPYIEQDRTPHDLDYEVANKILDAILPQVRTEEELEALPDGAIVTTPWQSYRWRATLRLLLGAVDGFDHEPSGVLTDGPLTVVWRPS